MWRHAEPLLPRLALAWCIVLLFAGSGLGASPAAAGVSAQSSGCPQGAVLTTTPLPDPNRFTLSWACLDPTGHDWVGLYPSGALDSDYLGRAYIAGPSGSLQVQAPTAFGIYHLRLFCNGVRVATSNQFRVY